MSNFVANILFLVILNIIGQNDSLVELPQVVDNDILKTELTIRAITNKLFTSIKLKGVTKNPKLKQYRLIHNYFVSLTLKDYNNLKEIARLTRVDKKTIDNTSINFIDLINEILNEGHFDFEANSNSFSYAFNDEVVNYIDHYSNDIAYLKATYGDSSPRADINKGIIDILEKDKIYFNTTALREQRNTSDFENLLTDNEFWVPDLRRIYAGKRTKIKDFPFMASVEIFNRFQCAGSIIKNDLVITAASCLQLAWNNRFYRENPAFLSVRIGSDYFEFGGENIPVLEVYFYPSYNPKTLRNNIAIMRLVRKIKFRRKKKKVRKISFDTKDLPLSMCTHGITIVGWGAKTKSNIIHNPYESKLSCARLDVYLLEDCQDIYSSEYVTRKNFCAGFISKGSGACNKDVGGPGIVAGVLKGIVSFGSPVCGTPDAPTVFTKVGYYADWIEEIMDQESSIPVLNRYTTTMRPRNTFYPPSGDPSEELIKTLSTAKTPYVDSLTVAPDTSDGTQVYSLFKNYLKTMFNSKEVEDYFNSGKYGKTHKKNVGKRHKSKIKAYTHKKPYYSYGITPVEHNSEELPQAPAYVPPALFAKETFKSFDRTTNIDGIQVFKAGETQISSQETLNIDEGLDSETSEEIESKETIKNGIKTLIRNVNLEEKIAEVTKNSSSRVLENNGRSDKTILTLLHKSDADKGSNFVQEPNDNQITTQNKEDDKSEPDNEIESKFGSINMNDKSLDEDGIKIYDQQELRWNEKSQEEVKVTKITNNVDILKKDTNVNTNNVNTAGNDEKAFGGIFSKKLLHDIVSHFVTIRNMSKTVNN